MKLYFFSGLGANQRAFKNLKISKDFEPVFIEWNIPERGESLDHYVQRFAHEINVNEEFALVGLSFGGIIVQELNKYVNPEKTVLISSLQNRKQMPKYMKLSSRTAAHRAIPMRFFTSDKLISYAFFRKLYNPKMPGLDEFFTYKDPYYLRWSIDKIVNWRPSVEKINGLYQMHGTKDIVFPHKYLMNEADLIQNGTHIMVLQKPKEVTTLLHQYLNK